MRTHTGFGGGKDSHVSNQLLEAARVAMLPIIGQHMQAGRFAEAQSLSDKLEALDKRQAQLDLELAEATGLRAKLQETRQMYDGMVTAVPVCILDAKTVTPPAPVDGGDWQRWYKGARSYREHPEHISFADYCKEQAAAAAAKAKKEEPSPAASADSSASPTTPITQSSSSAAKPKRFTSIAEELAFRRRQKEGGAEEPTKQASSAASDSSSVPSAPTTVPTTAPTTVPTTAPTSCKTVSSAPRLSGPCPANVVQGAFWRLSAQTHTPQTKAAAEVDHTVSCLEAELAQVKADKRRLQAQLLKGCDIQVQRTPVGPGPADKTVATLQQELAATRAQLAAAVQDAAAFKARLGATERYLLRVMVQMPILPPKGQFQRQPVSSVEAPKQHQQQGVPAVPQQPSCAEPQRMGAQVPELQQMARSTASVEACQADRNQQQVKAADSPPAAAPAAQDDEQGAVEQPVTPPVAAGSPVNPLSPRESVSDGDSSTSSSILATLWGHFTGAVTAASANKASTFSWSVGAEAEYVAGMW